MMAGTFKNLSNLSILSLSHTTLFLNTLYSFIKGIEIAIGKQCSVAHAKKKVLS